MSLRILAVPQRDEGHVLRGCLPIVPGDQHPWIRDVLDKIFISRKKKLPRLREHTTQATKKKERAPHLPYGAEIPFSRLERMIVHQSARPRWQDNGLNRARSQRLAVQPLPHLLIQFRFGYMGPSQVRREARRPARGQGVETNHEGLDRGLRGPSNLNPC